MKFLKCPECEAEVPQWYHQPGRPVEPSRPENSGDEEEEAPATVDRLEDPGRHLTGVPCPECGSPLPPTPEIEQPSWRVPAGGPQLWGRVLQRWNEDKVHDDFVRFCGETGCLDYAARRYRRRANAEQGGAQDERATRMLDRIRERAVAGLVPTLRKERRPVSSLTWAISGILAALLALFIAYMIRRLGVVALP